MTKNMLVLGISILVLLVVVFYLRSGLNAPAPTESTTATSTAAISASAATGETVKTAVPDAIGKTNPFQSDVNPVSGYQNPFGQ